MICLRSFEDRLSRVDTWDRSRVRGGVETPPGPAHSAPSSDPARVNNFPVTHTYLTPHLKYNIWSSRPSMWSPVTSDSWLRAWPQPSQDFRRYIWCWKNVYMLQKIQTHWPRSLKVRSPGHVKWPHLRISLNARHSYTDWPIVCRNIERLITISIQFISRNFNIGDLRSGQFCDLSITSQ